MNNSIRTITMETIPFIKKMVYPRFVELNKFKISLSNLFEKVIRN